MAVMHIFNPEHSGGRGRWISESESSLVCRVSSRTAMAMQRNLILRNKNKQTNKKPKTKSIVTEMGTVFTVTLEHLSLCPWVLGQFSSVRYEFLPMEGALNPFKNGWLLPKHLCWRDSSSCEHSSPLHSFP